ncbi:MAG: hypothetical protein ACYC3I_09850 [Gemmataceae bacterium]
MPLERLLRFGSRPRIPTLIAVCYGNGRLEEGSPSTFSTRWSFFFPTDGDAGMREAGAWHNRFRQELKLVVEEEYAHMMQEAIGRKHVSNKQANLFGERLEQNHHGRDNGVDGGPGHGQAAQTRTGSQPSSGGPINR